MRQRSPLAIEFLGLTLSCGMAWAQTAPSSTRVVVEEQIALPTETVIGAPLPAPLTPPGCERLAIIDMRNTDDGWTTATLAGDVPEAGGGVLAWRGAGESMSGFLRGDDGRRWRIIAADTGSRLELVDVDRLPPCAEIPSRASAEALVHAHEGGLVDAGMLAACDTGRPIDVLVVYTAAARATAGGKSAIEGQITAAIAAANASYGNSRINARLNLLMQTETDYVSSDFGTDLGRLAATNDGQLDWVHALRDTIGADMVAMVRVDGEYCGIAYLMYSNGPESQDIPFSVTALGCLSNQTLAHELGHNMGCCHASGDGGGCTGGGLWSYSLGWRFNGQSGSQFRTIMAYAPGNRIDYFSNPRVNYDARPTGVTIGQANEADNATTINDTWQTISGFRCNRGAVSQADCDGNASVDALDIAFGLGSDCDGDGALDDCGFNAAQPCTTNAARAFCPAGIVSSRRNPAPAASDYFGQSVGCSATVAAVGAPGDDDRGSFAGKVAIYERTGEVWAYAGTVYAPDAAASAQFGASVAVDRDLVLVGASAANAGGIPTGRVYVFARTPGGWSVVQTIECPMPTYGDLFGDKMVVRDGLLLVGSRGNRANALVSAGAAFVFERAGDAFTFRQRLTAPTPQTQALFGFAVATDGARIVVATPYETTGNIMTGAAYVYTRVDGAWTLETRLQGSNTSSRFGSAVTIDGDRVVVGAPGDTYAGYEAGAVYSYRFAGSWYPTTVLRPSMNSDRTRLGNGVALSGSRLLASTKPDQSATGVTTLFLEQGVDWIRQSTQYSGNALFMQRDFGMVGAPYSDELAVDSGAARIIMWASDCNGNGIPDRCDIDLGAASDANGNGVPDACGEAIYDLDGNGFVDFGDVSLVLLNMGACPAPCPYDLSGDGWVDSGDLSLLLLQFG